jgi:hypothetical protein
MENLEHSNCELQQKQILKLGELNVSTIGFLTCNENMVALLHDIYLSKAFHHK